ncbi:hypothetical protein QV65_23655 [Rhodococcus erythropolis]|nr:hypothetical protein QV65_23655 [Rhodococcus erythropolis]
MAVDGPATRSLTPAPDLLEQRLPRDRRSRPLRQVGDEIEFGASQVDFLRITTHSTFGQVDHDVAELEQVGHRASSVLRTISAPKQCLNTGDEDTHAERLAQIIVGPDAETYQHVGFIGTSGQHQHGHGAHGLDAAADFEAVESRHHHVEHH